MVRIIWSPNAVDDLEAICDYITRTQSIMRDCSLKE